MYTEVVQFTVFLPEKISLNKIYSGIPFRERSQHKDEYYFAVLASNIPRYHGAYPVRMRYHFRVPGTKLDISNHAYMLKMVEDALVHAKIIEEDDQRYVREITITSEKQDDCAVDITIEPCE